MSRTFRIHLLPARHGDCIWVEWGEEGATRQLMIDGGPVGAYPALRDFIRGLPDEKRRLELLVVTHVDADHIDGAVKLLKEPGGLLEFRDIWFNGWPQLDAGLGRDAARPEQADGGLQRGPLTGEYMNVLIARRGERWNASFQGAAILVPEHGRLPRIALDGGLVLTLLSPTPTTLVDLRKEWRKKIEAIGAVPGDVAGNSVRLDQDKRLRGMRGPAAPAMGILDAAETAPKLDASVANGSSIAFMAEYEGRRCAFLADAHAPVVEASIARLATERGERRLRLDALKVSHHGSDANTTTSLLRGIDCRTYLVSTDGSVFGHPDEGALTRIVQEACPARLLFNYRSQRNQAWGAAERQSTFGHTAIFPSGETAGVALDLLAPTTRA